MGAITSPPAKEPAALATVASSGIGVALAPEGARRSHALILVARRAGRLRETADRISSEQGVGIEWLAVDLTDAADRDRIPDEVAGRKQSWTAEVTDRLRS